MHTVAPSPFDAVPQVAVLKVCSAFTHWLMPVCVTGGAANNNNNNNNGGVFTFLLAVGWGILLRSLHNILQNRYPLL